MREESGDFVIRWSTPPNLWPPGRPDDRWLCSDHSCTTLWSHHNSILCLSHSVVVLQSGFYVLKKEIVCASPTRMFDLTVEHFYKFHFTKVDPCAATSLTVFCCDSRNDSLQYSRAWNNNDDTHEHTYVKSQMHVHCTLSHTSLWVRTDIRPSQRAKTSYSPPLMPCSSLIFYQFSNLGWNYSGVSMTQTFSLICFCCFITGYLLHLCNDYPSYFPYRDSSSWVRFCCIPRGAFKLSEAHKGPILLCVALLHHPAPGHSRTAQTPVLSGQNHILNLPHISHFIELQQEFLCWVIHLCTWFGHTFETKQASQG